MINSKIRPAKKKDFNYFFKDEKVLYSAKAWVLIQGKNRLAIGGIWLMPKQFISFVRIKQIISKKEFWKASKLITKELLKLNIPITCFRDKEQLNSKNYLEKLGYKYFKTINNEEVYKLWHK